MFFRECIILSSTVSHALLKLMCMLTLVGMFFHKLVCFVITTVSTLSQKLARPMRLPSDCYKVLTS